MSFREGLMQLSAHTVPLIDAMTKAAYVSPVNEIVRLLNDHLTNVKPKYKLSTLFLVDSICKYGIKDKSRKRIEFAEALKPIIFYHLPRIYPKLEKADRNKVGRMILTWKDHPKGENLVFALDWIVSLENEIRSYAARALTPTPGAPVKPPAPKLGPNGNATLGLQQQIMTLLPQMKNSPDYPVLEQLLQAIETEPLDRLTISQIQAKISEMSRVKPQPVVQPPPVAPLPTQTNINPSLIGQLASSLGLLAPKSVIQLKQRDIDRPNLQMHETIYSRLDIKCQQCAVRFTKYPRGGEEMKQHLDWHFRENKRKRDIKRSTSRQFYLDPDDWVKERPSDTRELATISSLFEDKKEEEQSAGEVLPWKQNKNPVCPICMDEIVKFYDDAQEEWLLKGAVLKKDTYYHAECFQSTPQLVKLTADNLEPGTKRVKTEGDASPALKRVKLENVPQTMQDVDEDDIPQTMQDVDEDDLPQTMQDVGVSNQVTNDSMQEVKVEPTDSAPAPDDST
ncbi:hypothetical protein EDD86DRAFT_212624 [Gorgonomyces haynaldii]|nr:hypothetical protein EDD86DRAFT_212624 [Gorgonomyces haynaldii]